eukprot:9021760-Alexandrium_andersonii.AAC.1
MEPAAEAPAVVAVEAPMEPAAEAPMEPAVAAPASAAEAPRRLQRRPQLDAAAVARALVEAPSA